MLDYYYRIIMIGLALFIFERAILACVFKHIAELKGYYGIKEWLLVFFLGIYGILYIWMLPIKNDKLQEAEADRLTNAQL